MLEKMKKIANQCFDGDVTIPKGTLWLIGAVCLLAGIVYGLRKAPMTHGVTIASNNGNQSNCTWGGGKEDKEETTEEQEIEE